MKMSEVGEVDATGEHHRVSLGHGEDSCHLGLSRVKCFSGQRKKNQ